MRGTSIGQSAPALEKTMNGMGSFNMYVYYISIQFICTYM